MLNASVFVCGVLVIVVTYIAVKPLLPGSTLMCLMYFQNVYSCVFLVALSVITRCVAVIQCASAVHEHQDMRSLYLEHSGTLSVVSV